MKVKSMFLSLLVVLIVLSVSLLSVYAEDLREWHEVGWGPLPEGAKTWAGRSTTLSVDIAYSPNGNLLAIADGHYIWLFDVDREKRALLTDDVEWDDSGPVIHFYSVAFSPDGRTLAISGHDTVRLWAVARGGKTATFRWEEEDDFPYEVSDLAFSPDGRTLAGGDFLTKKLPVGWQAKGLAWEQDYVVHLWAVASEGITATLPVHWAWVESVAFNPGNDTLAGGCDDGTVRLWAVRQGGITATLPGHKFGVWSVAWSPIGTSLGGTGGFLASGGKDGIVRLWDVNSISISLVGTLTASNGPAGAVRLVDVAFSPDGRTLASASGFDGLGTLRLWDVGTGKLIATLNGRGNEVQKVAFSPDGRTLASADSREVIIWDLAHESIRGPADANIASEPIRIPADVNNDGTVDVQDIVAVAAALGETRETPADVNNDGTVNIQDLVTVAAAFGDNAANAQNAPAAARRSQLSTETLQQWIAAAEDLNLTDATVRKGIHVLTQLLATLTPTETELLANNPNPFNPETWIPYRLAIPAEVSLSIYAVDGHLVRRLDVGHRPAGHYDSRSRAAYWDGKNALGEPVASGVYFYTLEAGDFKATRKMVIRK